MRKVRILEEAGFTLIEMLIVVLLVGILAAVAAPLYLGYTKDAKTAEGKALVGSVWTAWQAAAQQNCDAPQTITAAYPKAGLNAEGKTNPLRWDVSAAEGETLEMTCADGALEISGAVLISGVATDVSTIRIGLNYDSGETPPVVLKCTSDGSDPFDSDTASPC